MKAIRFFQYFIFVLFIMLSTKAYSAATGSASGQGLPWEDPINKVQQSLFFVGVSLTLIGFFGRLIPFLLLMIKKQVLEN